MSGHDDTVCECRYVTHDELSSLSAYMTARLSLEKVLLLPGSSVQK